jgi:hypothetical protein
MTTFNFALLEKVKTNESNEIVHTLHVKMSTHQQCLSAFFMQCACVRYGLLGYTRLLLVHQTCAMKHVEFSLLT